LLSALLILAAGGKKKPRRGMGARYRGSGHGHYFYCGNFVRGKARNSSQRVDRLLSRSRGGLKTATRALVK